MPCPPSSALVCLSSPTYMATTMMLTCSLIILCHLVFARAAAAVAAAAAAAGLINARSFIAAIEQEGSKPSFNALG